MPLWRHFSGERGKYQRVDSVLPVTEKEGSEKGLNALAQGYKTDTRIVILERSPVFCVSA